jgi:ketosteroid isomerase-like protein
MAYQNTYAWFLQFERDEIVSAVAFLDSIEFAEFWKRFSP